MNEQAKSAESSFGQAIEIQLNDDRAAFLHDACGGDQQLRAEVEKLVADHFRAGSSFRTGGEATAAVPPGMERVGSHSGLYRLRERLGADALNDRQDHYSSVMISGRAISSGPFLLPTTL